MLSNSYMVYCQAFQHEEENMNVKYLILAPMSR